MKKQEDLRIRRAFNLLQPWAERVVTGELPILIRSIRARPPGKRVAVYATNSFDKTTLHNYEGNHKELTYGAVIGSVEIKKCLEVPTDQLAKKIEEIGGNELLDSYPIQWVPDQNPLYLWILKKPKKWKNPKKLIRVGRAWTIVDLWDE